MLAVSIAILTGRAIDGLWCLEMEASSSGLRRVTRPRDDFCTIDYVWMARALATDR
jgi:hypothetical protein